MGLKRLPETRLETLPRMADFALWATACEPALWVPGAFAEAYQGNRDTAVDNVIDADPVADAVRTFTRSRTLWTGNASDLLGALNLEIGDTAARAKTWPKAPHALAGRLRRAATCLRKVGINITFDRAAGGDRVRTIKIERVGIPASQASRASQTEENQW
jgi:hypothetical protein